MRAAATEVDAVQAGVQLDAVAAALETVAVYGLQGVGRLRRESARQRAGERGEEERKSGKRRKGERVIETEEDMGERQSCRDGRGKGGGERKGER